MLLILNITRHNFLNTATFLNSNFNKKYVNYESYNKYKISNCKIKIFMKTSIFFT